MATPIHDVLFAPNEARETVFLHLADGSTLTHRAFATLAGRLAGLIVAQGVFGSIPWNALAFGTMWLHARLCCLLCCHALLCCVMLRSAAGCAMRFALWLQYVGFSDVGASACVSCAILGMMCAHMRKVHPHSIEMEARHAPSSYGRCGNLLGGVLGDAAAARAPDTGRVRVAQLSVALGIGAALLHWPIDERAVPRLAEAA